MQLEIFTPNEKVFSGEVTLVKVPGSSGSFEILKNHAPIISALGEGELKFETEAGEMVRYTITSGVIEVKSNHIVALAESILKVQ